MKNYDCYKQRAPQNYNIVYSEYKPISAWGYVGYNILYSIPVLGWLVWLCHALSPTVSARRSYARSFFCAFLIALLIVAVIAIALVAFVMVGFGGVERFLEYIQPYLDAYFPAA